jgi:hypothetical protein
MIKRKQPKILEPADLLTIPVASKQLGAGYSRNSILRRIESGEWAEGIHWIDDRRAGTSRRRILIVMSAVSALRSTSAAYRR